MANSAHECYCHRWYVTVSQPFSLSWDSAKNQAESRCLHFPSLAEATLEDLTIGLEKGKFNTVDLVQV